MIGGVKLYHSSTIPGSVNLQSRKQIANQQLISLDNLPLLTTTAPQVEEMLVRDENMKDLYMPLCSSIVLKRKKEMLYVLLDFNDCLLIDAQVDSRAYVSSIAEKELEELKYQTPPTSSKVTNLQIFEYDWQTVF